MPKFRITAPDGTKYDVNAPDGATEQDALAYVQKQHAFENATTAKTQSAESLNGPGPQPRQQRPLAQDVRSILGGIYQVPNDIAQSALEIGARGTDTIGLTKGAYPMLHKGFTESNPKNDPAFTTGRIIGQTIATLPLTELKVLKGAGSLAKIGNAATQGASAAAMTSSNSDAPLAEQLLIGGAAGMARPALGATAKLAAKSVPTFLGNVSTGAGANSVREAYQAGKAGGAQSQAFLGSLRGNVPWSEVVDDAKAALGKMRQERNAAYRSGMADISQDKTVLDFKPVDDAIAKSNAGTTFKGKDLSPKTAEVRKEVDDVIAEWKASDPAEFHTPEGFDALKQRLGDIKDALPYNTRQRTVAENAYNAVRKAIADQAPAYDKVMKDYSEASDLVSEIQRELSLGPKGNPNTALRKLQSVMRDNVNTSFGDRAKLARNLEEAGAATLMPSLAGQSLSSVLPRGLAKYGDLGLAAAATLHNPGALAALPLASPRVVGEGAHALGSAARNVQGLLAPLPRPALSPLLGAFAPPLVYQGAQ